MELFELFGKIVIGGAEEANRKIDSVADNAELKALKISNAFERMGKVKLNFDSNLNFPQNKLLNPAGAAGVYDLINNIKNTFGNLQTLKSEKTYTENICHENRLENVEIQKNITEFDTDSADIFSEKISSISEKLKKTFEFISKREAPEFDNLKIDPDILQDKTIDLDMNISASENDFLTNYSENFQKIKNSFDNIGKQAFTMKKAVVFDFSDNEKNADSCMKNIKTVVDKSLKSVERMQNANLLKIYENSKSSWNKIGNTALNGTKKMAVGIKSASASVYSVCDEIANDIGNKLSFDASGSGNFVMETFENELVRKAAEVYNTVSNIASNISLLMSSISIPEISASVKSYTVNSPSDLKHMPAHAQGGIVTREHIARVGEDGAEAIIPLEHNTEWIDKVAARMSGSTSNSAVAAKLDELISLLKNQKIYLDGKTLVGGISGEMDKKLGSMARLKRRSV